MTDQIKVIAQISPSATVLTDFYTAPISTSTAVSSIVICNTNSVDATFRVAIAVDAEADAIKQYIYYDMPLLANDSFVATIGITLNSEDIVRVQADTDNVAFSLFGVEVI